MSRGQSARLTLIEDPLFWLRTLSGSGSTKSSFLDEWVCSTMSGSEWVFSICILVFTCFGCELLQRSNANTRSERSTSSFLFEGVGSTHRSICIRVYTDFGTKSSFLDEWVGFFYHDCSECFFYLHIYMFWLRTPSEEQS